MTHEGPEVWAVPGRSTIIDVIHRETGLTLVYGWDAANVLAEYPTAERMPYAAWVVAVGRAQQTPIVWEATTAAQYDAMLNVLPPLDWCQDGFLVGEAADHCVVTGKPRYEAYRVTAGQYTVSSRPLTRAEWRAAR